MRFLVSKVVDAADASRLHGLLKQGFTIAAWEGSVPADAASNGTSSPSRGEGKKRVARRRRVRAPQKATPEMRAEMTALRKSGKIWRVIGRRFGVSASRAWQIVNKGV
jgi:hypothetical protein